MKTCQYSDQSACLAGHAPSREGNDHDTHLSGWYFAINNRTLPLRSAPCIYALIATYSRCAFVPLVVTHGFVKFVYVDHLIRHTIAVMCTHSGKPRPQGKGRQSYPGHFALDSCISVRNEMVRSSAAVTISSSALLKALMIAAVETLTTVHLGIRDQKPSHMTTSGVTPLVSLLIRGCCVRLQNQMYESSVEVFNCVRILAVCHPSMPLYRDRSLPGLMWLNFVTMSHFFGVALSTRQPAERHLHRFQTCMANYIRCSLASLIN